MQLVLYTSLRLQIPCTYSLPTVHIYSTSYRRHIWNPVEHLRWSFFPEIVNVLILLWVFSQKSSIVQKSSFDWIFDSIPYSTLSNNLWSNNLGLMRSVPSLELHKRILDFPCLLIHLTDTNNKEKLICYVDR